jgi:hypothetical protein
VDFFNVIIENFTMSYSIRNVRVNTFIRRPPESIVKIRQYNCIKGKSDEENDQQRFLRSQFGIGELSEQVVQDAGDTYGFGWHTRMNW